MKAATLEIRALTGAEIISIHAAREGGDKHRPEVDPCLLCISIHAAREGGDSIYDVIETINIISIHAAREGGDLFVLFALVHRAYFNPRRP